MTNLLTVVPDLNTQDYSHIIPSLERNAISTADLLSLDALDIAKRARVPPDEVRKLVQAVIENVKSGISQQLKATAQTSHCISLLDDSLDDVLSGGVHTGFLTEIAGESAAGKTQCLLTLLLSVQTCKALGKRNNALYISTEAQLSTQRLTQILQTHPRLLALSEKDRPSLERIQSTQIRDLESQEHVLHYQVPVIVERHNIGLLIIDSIAANYRAEFDKGQSKRSAESFAKRSLQVSRLAYHLREMARKFNIAVVVANQVADRFDTFDTGWNQLTQRGIPSSNQNGQPSTVSSHTAVTQSNDDTTVPSIDDPLSLDHQQRFFSGWGDEPAGGSFKTPSLGLTWTNQLATRLVLIKTPVYAAEVSMPGAEKDLIGWKRDLKVVFSSWCAAGSARFEIWSGGIRQVTDTPEQ